jgi:hypothetical protein
MLTFLDLVGVGINYVHIDYLKIDLRRKTIVKYLSLLLTEVLSLNSDVGYFPLEARPGGMRI